MISRRIVIVLVVGAVMLPVALALLVGVGRLLGGMGDAAGAGALDRAALAVGLLWGLDLVSLVTALGMQNLFPPEE